MMRGRAMKEKLAALMRQHRMRPIECAPLPLFFETVGPQIIEGIAASADVDAERMAFLAGSLIWPDDLGQLPCLRDTTATARPARFSACITIAVAACRSARWSRSRGASDGGVFDRGDRD